MFSIAKKRKLVSLKISIPPALAVLFLTLQAVQIEVTFLIISLYIGHLDRREIDDKTTQFKVLMEREWHGLEGLIQSHADWIESYEFVQDPSIG